MSDPLIKSMVKWWFWLFAIGCATAYLGVIAFIGFGVNAGTMQSSAYIYVGVLGILMFLLIAWIRVKISSAPEMIEGFLKRMGLFKDKAP